MEFNKLWPIQRCRKFTPTRNPVVHMKRCQISIYFYSVLCRELLFDNGDGFNMHEIKSESMNPMVRGGVAALMGITKTKVRTAHAVIAIILDHLNLINTI